MRHVLVATLALATLHLAPVTPATAAGGDTLVFAGNVEIDCFGCGSSHGSASLTVLGSLGSTVVSGTATASYTVTEGSGTDCLLSGTASGTISGAVNESFTWARSGPFLFMSMTGDFNGQATATMVPTGPAGLPCGVHNFTAKIEGIQVEAPEPPYGPPATDCTDLRDNDSDGQTDWPNDPGCDSPFDTSES